MRTNEGDGAINYGGKHVELSPHTLASYGFYYAPPQGFNFSAVASYVGNRYLDRALVISTLQVNDAAFLAGI